eukprot:2669077-Pyramimonas_sp.AAC.1
MCIRDSLSVLGFASFAFALAVALRASLGAFLPVRALRSLALRAGRAARLALLALALWRDI